MTEKRKKKAVAPTATSSPGAPLRGVTVVDGVMEVDADRDLYVAGMRGAMGSISEPFQNLIMGQIVQVLPKREDGNYTADLNAVLAMLQGIAPANELEAMLAAQMVATHLLALETGRRTRFAEQLSQYQAHGNIATKFARTFTSQIEALAKLRRGGEQVIRHIYVGEGGQAVFAKTINQGGGGAIENDGQAFGTGQSAECASVLGEDPARH